MPLAGQHEVAVSAEPISHAEPSKRAWVIGGDVSRSEAPGRHVQRGTPRSIQRERVRERVLCFACSPSVAYVSPESRWQTRCPVRLLRLTDGCTTVHAENRRGER